MLVSLIWPCKLVIKVETRRRVGRQGVCVCLESECVKGHIRNETWEFACFLNLNTHLEQLCAGVHADAAVMGGNSLNYFIF